MEKRINYIINRFALNGIDIDVDTAELLEKLYVDMVEYNENINITAITQFEEVVDKHFIDSVLIADMIPKNATVMDLGSGGGFPALPLKLVRPDLNIVMLDSVDKKLNFIRQTISKYNIEGCAVLHGRIEDVAHSMQHRGMYDVVTCRSLARLNELIEYSVPFIKDNGVVIAYKGKTYNEEIAECDNVLHALNANICSVEHRLLQPDINRYYVLINKCGETPKQYPRTGGKVHKTPIK